MRCAPAELVGNCTHLVAHGWIHEKHNYENVCTEVPCSVMIMAVAFEAVPQTDREDECSRNDEHAEDPHVVEVLHAIVN